MDWFKKGLITVVSLWSIQFVQAQQHVNAWLRATVNVPVSEKVSLDAEFNHRRQNGYDNSNLFDRNLLFGFRNWVHYQHSEDVKFSVSPFAYFSSYKMIEDKTDEIAGPKGEIRFSAAADLQHQLFKKFFIVDRTAVEYRIFDGDQSDITRLRNRIGFRYNFNPKVNLSVYDELLFNMTGVSHDHIFDQDRIGVNLGYKLLPHLKLDVGYMHLSRLPLKSTTKIHEDDFILNMTYYLPHRGRGHAG